MAISAVNTSANGLARVEAPLPGGATEAETAPLGVGLAVELAVVVAVLAVDAVVLKVARLKVEFVVVKTPVEAPLTRLVIVLLSGMLRVVMVVLLRKAVMESVVDGTVAVMVTDSDAELADKAEVIDTDVDEEADETAEEANEAPEEAAEDGEPPERVIKPE